MKERPILFSGPMIRALLAGQKTQTRRAVKKLPLILNRETNSMEVDVANIENGRFTEFVHCPYGQPGDRLWVREATINVEEHGYKGPAYAESEDGRACLEFGLSADPDDCVEVEPEDLRIRPSIHMPRAYCRITLEITGVRVERLQDISNADALSEGVNVHPDHHGKPPTSIYSPVQAYRNLWEQINGPGSWDDNPWVWAVSFSRVTP